MSAESAAYPTLMHKEAAEASDSIERLATNNHELFARIGAKLRENPPRGIITVARGSSDHAAVYAKYLIGKYTGLPVLSAPPSFSSVYECDINVGGWLCLSISQSGRSPDLVSAANSMKRSGAFTLALVNEEASPLADASDLLVPLHAGPERSVAATKSFIASLASILWIVAEWAESRDLQAAARDLPTLLKQAWLLDWSNPLAELKNCRGLFTIGRGLGLGVAGEAALKFKETSQIHAEAFSAAECSHGPLTLLGLEFPALVFSQADASEQSIRDLVSRMQELNAPIYLAGPSIDGTTALPVIDAHPAVQPILMAQSFYRAVADLSLARGLNPDLPPALTKVTETV